MTILESHNTAFGLEMYKFLTLFFLQNQFENMYFAKNERMLQIHLLREVRKELSKRRIVSTAEIRLFKWDDLRRLIAVYAKIEKIMQL